MEKELFESAKKSSLSGIIIPDLAIDHADSLLSLSKEFGVQLIFLVTPQSSPERIEYIAKQSSGFVYVVSTTGITGEQRQLADSLKSFVSSVKSHTQTPVCVGFLVYILLIKFSLYHLLLMG